MSKGVDCLPPYCERALRPFSRLLACTSLWPCRPALQPRRASRTAPTLPRRPVCTAVYHYAPVKIEYAVNRYAMETKRQLDVLDKQLAKHKCAAAAATLESRTKIRRIWLRAAQSTSDLCSAPWMWPTRAGAAPIARVPRLLTSRTRDQVRRGRSVFDRGYRHLAVVRRAGAGASL